VAVLIASSSTARAAAVFARPRRFLVSLFPWRALTSDPSALLVVDAEIRELERLMSMQAFGDAVRFCIEKAPIHGLHIALLACGVAPIL